MPGAGGAPLSNADLNFSGNALEAERSESLDIQLDNLGCLWSLEFFMFFACCSNVIQMSFLGTSNGSMGYKTG